jgi:hypothetical protein
MTAPLLVLALAAVPLADPRAASIAELHPCKAERVQHLATRVASTATVARAMRLGGASTARIVKPGQAIAMDYQTDRLTIEVDAKNRILRLSCG